MVYYRMGKVNPSNDDVICEMKAVDFASKHVCQ